MQPPDAWPEWFERVWQYREEVLYPALFGAERKGIFTLQADRPAARDIDFRIDPQFRTMADVIGSLLIVFLSSRFFRRG